MAAYDPTLAAQIFKEVYDSEEVQSLIPKHTKIWDRFSKWDEPAEVGPGGLYFKGAVTVSLPDSVVWAAFLSPA